MLASKTRMTARIGVGHSDPHNYPSACTDLSHCICTLRQLADRWAAAVGGLMAQVTLVVVWGGWKGRERHHDMEKGVGRAVDRGWHLGC